MLCPTCKQRAPVRDSRETSDGRRRRYACVCGQKFTTVEFVVDTTDSKDGLGGRGARISKGKRWLQQNEVLAKEAGRNEIRTELKRLFSTAEE